MSLVALPLGLLWPWGERPAFGSGGSITLDAAGEKVAFIGRVYLEGRPAAAKTINTSGSSNLIWSVASSPVFDNASSEFRVGFQGVDSTTGVPARPDGTWSVYAAVTTASNASPTLTTSSNFHEKAPTSGSLSITHGDLVAVVCEMTSRAGSDSVAVQTNGGARGMASGGVPATVNNTSGSWVGMTSIAPLVVFVCSDGTRGYIDGGFPALAESLIWSDATNPDEVGEAFQVPFACKADAFTLTMRTADANSDFTVTLYSDPFGTPTALATVTWLAEKFGPVATEFCATFPLSTEVDLSASTDYVVAVKATGSGNIRLTRVLLSAAADRTLLGPGGTTLNGVTRNNGSGAFSSSTTTHYPLGVRLSQVQDGSGSAGGLLTHPGMAGGMRG